jgi:hypothetical protein
MVVIATSLIVSQWVFYPITADFTIGPFRFSTVQFPFRFFYGAVLIGASTATMNGYPAVKS